MSMPLRTAQGPSFTGEHSDAIGSVSELVSLVSPVPGRTSATFFGRPFGDSQLRHHQSGMMFQAVVCLLDDLDVMSRGKFPTRDPGIIDVNFAKARYFLELPAMISLRAR